MSDVKVLRQLAFFMDAAEQRLYVRDAGNGVELYHEVADLDIIASFTSLPAGAYCVSVTEKPQDFDQEPEEAPVRDPLGGLS